MYVNLVESVKKNGGKVFIFSSLHVTGEQLALYTGIMKLFCVIFNWYQYAQNINLPQ